MLSQLFMAKSAFFTFERKMQMVANNIANSQTPGFKRQRMEIESLFPLVLERAYSEFEVKVSWDNGGGSVGTAHLMLQPYRDSAEILECSNMQPSLSYTRGDNGQLEKIELNIDPNTSRGGWGIDCKVRLLADSEGPPRYTPHNGKWVHIGTRSYQQYVSSAFKKDETAQSLSEGCWVDG